MKFIYTIFVVLLLFSCSESNNKTEFSGNWYTCGKDGNYYELLIKEYAFKYSTKNGLITNWYKFRISGDTLIYEDPYLYKDSVIVIKSKISFINADEMKLNFTTSAEEWIFYRIEEKVNNIDNNDKLLIDTRKRAEKINCADKRSEKEKQQDSLMKNIDFQF